MADVQIDNGEFTRIANVLLEQTSMAHLNGTQHSIILTVWRFTYGFQRCEHKLSVTFIANATNISIRGIKKELKVLIDRNILLVSRESTKSESRVLKFNKDYETWREVEKVSNSEQGNNNTPGEQLTPSQGNNHSPQQGNKSTPKKETKENSKENINTIFKFWNDTKVIIHRSMSDKLRGHINARLTDYSVEEICKAITNYSTVLNGEQYYYTQKWRLEEFLLRRLENFLDESEPFKTYASWSAKGGIGKATVQGDDAKEMLRKQIAQQMSKKELLT